MKSLGNLNYYFYFFANFAKKKILCKNIFSFWHFRNLLDFFIYTLSALFALFQKNAFCSLLHNKILNILFDT